MTHYEKVVAILFRLISLGFIFNGLYKFLVEFISFLNLLFRSFFWKRSSSPQPEIMAEIRSPNFYDFLTIVFDYYIIYILIGIILFKLSFRLSKIVCKGIDNDI